MHRVLAGSAVALALAALAGGPARAEDIEAEVREAITAAKRVHPEIKASIDEGTGLPRRISGLKSRPDPTAALTVTRDAKGQPSEDSVRRAVEAFLATREISATFPQKNAKAKRVVSEIRHDPDIKGQSVAVVTQQVNGIPVFGSSARFIVNPRLAVIDITASFSTTKVETTEAKISEADAIKAARETLLEMLDERKGDPGLDRLGASAEGLQATAEKTFFDPALMRARGARQGPIRLAYLVRIEAFHFFVDAETSEVLFFYRDRPTVMVRRVFDLDGTSQFPGAQLIDEQLGVASQSLPEDGQRAMDNSGAVHAYFLSVLGRDSYDDVDGDGPQGGGALESYIRFDTMKNALWCKTPSFECPKPDVMVYGPGFAGALDVVAHEVTHGVISYSAGLIYSDESGAANEGFADIFGALVEFHRGGGKGNWVIGEQLPGASIEQPMRSMENPNLSLAGRSMFAKADPFSPSNRGQPDHYADYVDRDDPICETTYDYFNGCVHFNSGILNKLAHLVAVGGTHRGAQVKGIGVNKLGRVAYRALTMRLNPSSGLPDAGAAFGDACDDLAAAGVAGFSKADCAEVEKARRAVGLGPAGT
ncbi:MAG: M4 family metallopeptidase [Pseudomonadota bacterium]